MRAQAAALRRDGADVVVAVTHTDREMDYAIVRSRLVDVLLTGHDHDLAIGFDGKTVMVESNEEGNFVTAIDFVATVTGEGKDRKVAWSPSFRVHDSSTVDPDPEVQAVVRRYESALSKELDVEIGTSTTELDSRSAIVRSQEAAIGNLIADAIKASTGAEVAITNGGGIRGNKQYPAGAEARAAGHPHRAALRQRHLHGGACRARTSGRRWRTASRSWRAGPGASRRSRA